MVARRRAIDNTMTVLELISRLREVDPLLPVMTEGCDCLGTALGVSLEIDTDEDGNERPLVLITRHG